jgi:acyl carrier protein
MTMGPDTIELVIQVEKDFGIQIPNADAARLVSVGDLHRYVIDQLHRQRRFDGDAGTVYAQLRDLICAQLGVKPEHVIPSARFVDDLGAD